MLLSNARFLVTQDAQRTVLEDVDVRIEGSRIARIGRALPRIGDEGILDCSQRIVLPGLVNAHTHLGMTSLRGASDDKELASWLADVQRAEHAMSADDVRASAYLGVAEALRTGTTCVADQYYLPEATIEAAGALGMRALALRDFFTAHEPGLDAKRIGQLMPDAAALPPTVRVGVAPHSIYGTDEGFLRAARAYASAHRLRMMIHVAETRAERAECKRRLGMLPVEYLARIGFLGPDVVLAHCNWLTKGELDLVARSGACVAHCAQSNMKLAGGSAMPLREMLEREIPVALGTDSAASNNALDMFREMHVAALLHKHHYWMGDAVSAQQVFDMATLGGARAIGMEDLGSLEEGKLADIATLDLTDLNLMPVARERVVSHIVYAANGMNVADVIVDGRLLLRGKRFVEDAEVLS